LAPGVAYPGYPPQPPNCPFKPPSSSKSKRLKWSRFENFLTFRIKSESSFALFWRLFWESGREAIRWFKKKRMFHVEQKEVSKVGYLFPRSWVALIKLIKAYILNNPDGYNWQPETKMKEKAKFLLVEYPKDNDQRMR
jgi:hypothetical protein